MGKHGMVDESIALLKRCTIASVRRMDLQILCSKALLSRTAQLLAESGGDLIERSVGFSGCRQPTLVRDSDLFSIGKKAVT
jgi:hypothetical protein